MKTWDSIVVGAGVIGLSLAVELRRHGADVLLIDRAEPGREASHAAGGMIADLDPSLPAVLKPIATLSAQMYPDFVRSLVQESAAKIDFRTQGTIAFVEHPVNEGDGIRKLSLDEVRDLEPAIAPPHDPSYFMQENAIDPRDLIAALVASAQTLGVEIKSGSPVLEITRDNSRATGVRTAQETFVAASVVNCAGAWAPQIGPLNLPTRPVKGHMVALSLPDGHAAVLRHVVRSRWCYILPRSTGRYVVGSTVEPAGFDRSINSYRVNKLREAAIHLVPSFADATVAETWTGLRPGTPDNLPILGETSLSGYFACTGHYRDGILLAPASASLLSLLIRRKLVDIDLSPFSPARFSD